MKKVIMILILTALLSGCVNKDRTYYNEDNPNNTFTLKTDGTYQLVSDSPFKDDRKSAIYRLCTCLA